MATKVADHCLGNQSGSLGMLFRQRSGIVETPAFSFYSRDLTAVTTQREVIDG
ncbi:hypothetical protein [Photobacterium sp. OFAV2-7]|uniref:hypothetical protein n=1 Tax=Photobacterium sp. OFAV2-7 TaxID=2917748 RepID=UPI001EF58102|nr:hypothetical protein [Photobacterium sp. OFAV2-7]MCG7584585.1 hypothetical protein [Photobacterium sp. OFAV2-7]